MFFIQARANRPILMEARFEIILILTSIYLRIGTDHWEV